MRKHWRRGWTKADRREYMRLTRTIDRALKATDNELRGDSNLRWLRWHLDAKRISAELVATSFRSSLSNSAVLGY